MFQDQDTSTSGHPVQTRRRRGHSSGCRPDDQSRSPTGTRGNPTTSGMRTARKSTAQNCGTATVRVSSGTTHRARLRRSLCARWDSEGPNPARIWSCNSSGSVTKCISAVSLPKCSQDMIFRCHRTISCSFSARGQVSLYLYTMRGVYMLICLQRQWTRYVFIEK